MKNFTLFIFAMFIGFSMSAQVTIAEIQGDGDETPYLDQVVSTQGIITAVMYNGFFIQDGPGIDGRNGILVYIFTDFMLEEPWASEIAVGVEISMTAIVTEYFGMTEIKDLVTHSIVSTGNENYAPVLLETGNTQQEKYEGVLVKVQNAAVTEYTVDNHGYFEVNDGSGVAYVDDSGVGFKTDVDLIPVVGEDVFDITAPLMYSYDLYRLNPGTLDDIVDSGTSTAELFTEEQLTIYPNPVTNNNFTVRGQEIVSVEVINVLGQTIFESATSDVQNRIDIELNNPNEGVYMVKIDFADNTSKIFL
jgi:predicted extracellular nuclease